MDDRRAALTRLREELPSAVRPRGARGAARAADELLADATETYNALVPGARGGSGAAQGPAGVQGSGWWVETHTSTRAVELTQEALGTSRRGPGPSARAGPPSWSASSCPAKATRPRL